MRLWNMTNMSEVEDRVVLSYAGLKGQGRPNLARRAPPFRLTVAFAAATLLVGPTIRPLVASSAVVRVPLAAAGAQSGPVEGPPLADGFAARYEGEWTLGVEDGLLRSVAALHCAPADPDLDAERAIDNAYSNQQEDLSAGVNKLDRAVVARIVRGKKSTK